MHQYCLLRLCQTKLIFFLLQWTIQFICCCSSLWRFCTYLQLWDFILFCRNYSVSIEVVCYIELNNLPSSQCTVVDTWSLPLPCEICTHIHSVYKVVHPVFAPLDMTFQITSAGCRLLWHNQLSLHWLQVLILLLPLHFFRTNWWIVTRPTGFSNSLNCHFYKWLHALAQKLSLGLTSLQCWLKF